MAMEMENIENYTEGLPVLESIYEEPQYKESTLYQEYKNSIANGRWAVPTKNYKNLTLSISAAIQEVIMTNDADKTAEIMQRYQDEYNAEYAGE